MSGRNTVKFKLLTSKLIPSLVLLTLAQLTGAVNVLAQTLAPLTNACPEAIAKRLERYPAKAGETLNTIAQKYQLLPETLKSVNPQLASGRVKPGQIVLIPPFNGQFITVPAGATWRDLATAYGLRADILFELNGCQEKPTQVFIPGVTWTEKKAAAVDNYTGLKQWPIAPRPKIGLDYGWHNNGTNEADAFFHSGVDLIAPLNTPVVAAADGQVILVSQEGLYGFLVVVDHGNGRQTRYAHLSRFAVNPGQMITAGTVLGYVGTTGRPDIAEPHLHFEVRFKSPVGWAAQDPKLHLPR
jgi:murein DD-endopeptidase MepM/ murein hydrolase activator NlpD